MKFNRRQKKALRRILIAAALFLVLLLVRRLWPEVWWAQLIAAVPPYLIIGWPVLRKAWMGVLNRQPFDENLLMAVASLGAMALREFPEGVAVLLFYEIGELFEDVAVGRSRKSIADLMDIRPDYANLEIGDLLQQVEPETVEIGSVIVVKPGERVPLDGTVLDGASSLNLAALTGESVPVDVKAGDPVLSGSVNLTGVLRLRVEKVYGDSTVARILELVENSSLKKAKTEHFITRFARWYTPLVVLAAVVLAVLPPVLNMLHHNPAQWGEWIPPRAHVPRHQLPVRDGAVHPAHVLRRHRRRERTRHSHQGQQLSRAAREDRPRRVRQDRHAHARRVRGGRGAPGAGDLR